MGAWDGVKVKGGMWKVEGGRWEGGRWASA